jgi:serine protease AprX
MAQPSRIPRSLVERLLHDSKLGLRLIQDSPILPDVWAAYAAEPELPQNLLFSPAETISPPRAALALVQALRQRPSGEIAQIAPLQGFVTATLRFLQLIQVAAPMMGLEISLLSAGDAAAILQKLDPPDDNLASGEPDSAPTADERLAALIALIRFGGLLEGRPESFGKAAIELQRIADANLAAGNDMEVDTPTRPPLLRRVTLNRPVQRMETASIRTVKADAARKVFAPSAAGLTWAVIDSGIDATHPAFADPNQPGSSRIWRSYDFSRLRRLTSFDLLLLEEDSPDFKELLEQVSRWQSEAPSYPEDDRPTTSLTPLELLRRFRSDAEHEGQPSWALVETLLRLPPNTEPVAPHGTHVAGILAGNWPEQDFVGVCPDLRLLDIRILGDGYEETESSIIGALEFIRWLNGRNRWRVVHGANLSIGMTHDVRNWACGQTPICVACNDLVASGVVVVAAAGNDGWQSFLVGDEKRYEGYAAGSILDPGNAEAVITVGATHRERPHLYGVSFFSSRGPTGDGRMKPDLLAPGEKIDGPLPQQGIGALDGTSMAAPHVSGVAALLMARHVEFQGRPAEIKQVLMETAVDLGRERSAQGAGLIDALAALQRR